VNGSDQIKLGYRGVTFATVEMHFVVVTLAWYFFNLVETV
jgi:hypothetical protein